MYHYSKKSLKALNSSHIHLQIIFNDVIEIFDCSVLYGYRNKKKQEKMFEKGYTKLHFPRSKHNSEPSLAVDVVPYPIDWGDLNRFYFLAGIVKAIALEKNIKIRWGGDWNNNNNFKDQTWNDLPHYELI